MTVESATYISGLDPLKPTGSDVKQEGDNHIRLLKQTLINTWPNITGAVTATHTDLNYVSGIGGAAASQTYATNAASSAVSAKFPNVTTAVTADSAEINRLDGLTDAIADRTWVNNQITAASLSSTLPNQAGNAGKFVSTDGANANWTPIPAMHVQAYRYFGGF